MLRRDTSITVASPSNQIDRLFAIVGNVDRLFVAISRTPEGQDSGYVIYTLSTGSGGVDTR